MTGPFRPIPAEACCFFKKVERLVTSTSDGMKTCEVVQSRRVVGSDFFSALRPLVCLVIAPDRGKYSGAQIARTDVARLANERPLHCVESSKRRALRVFRAL